MDSQALYKQIGERIRQFRQAQRLNQEELAQKVGLTRTSITNIEKGRQRLLVDQLFVFATALGVELFDLLPTKHLLPSEFSTKLPRDLTDSEKEWVYRVISSTKEQDKGGDKK